MEQHEAHCDLSGCHCTKHIRLAPHVNRQQHTGSPDNAALAIAVDLCQYHDFAIALDLSQYHDLAIAVDLFQYHDLAIALDLSQYHALALALTASDNDAPSLPSFLPVKIWPLLLGCLRLLDTSVMVRRAAVQAAQQLLQTHTRDGPPRRWSMYIRLAEALCSLLTAAPGSPLASHALQQVHPPDAARLW